MPKTITLTAEQYKNLQVILINAYDMVNAQEDGFENVDFETFGHGQDEFEDTLKVFGVGPGY